MDRSYAWFLKDNFKKYINIRNSRDEYKNSIYMDKSCADFLEIISKNKKNERS